MSASPRRTRSGYATLKRPDPASAKDHDDLRDLAEDMRSDAGHLLQETPEAGQFLISPHDLNHRPERGLICRNDRFANRSLPFRYECNGWKIAARDDKYLNLRPISTRNRIVGQALRERWILNGIGAGESHARGIFQTMIDGVVTSEPVDRGHRKGR
jgi:hypothetical protein